MGNMKKKRKVSSYIVLALLIFAVWFYRDSMEEIWWGIRQISAKEILICMILATIYFVLDGFLIHYGAAPFSKQMTAVKGIKTTFCCEFYRLITLGSATFVAEIFYLCKSGVTLAQGTAVSAYKYAIKKLSIMLSGLAGFFWLSHLEYTSKLSHRYLAFAIIATVMCTVIISAFLLISMSEKIANLVVFLIEQLAKKIKWIGKNSENWIAQIKCLNTEGKFLWRQWRRNLVVLFVNLCKCIAIYAVVVVLLKGKSILSTWDIIAIMAVTYFLAGVIPVPSGVMALEYVFGLFMDEFLGIGMIGPAILSFRFFSWIFPACIGGILQFIDRFVKKEE